MIGYITVGTNDLAKAERFYNPLFSLLSVPQVRKTDRMIFWSNGKGPAFAVAKPYDGKAADFGNGTMVAFTAAEPQVVDKVHQQALNLGGADEGAPGPRGAQVYSAYFRDPDGNKILVFSPLR